MIKEYAAKTGHFSPFLFFSTNWKINSPLPRNLKLQQTTAEFFHVGWRSLAPFLVRNQNVEMFLMRNEKKNENH